MHSLHPAWQALGCSGRKKEPVREGEGACCCCVLLLCVVVFRIPLHGVPWFQRSVLKKPNVKY